MVRRVLENGLPLPPPCAPMALYGGDRLSAARVREAVAWVLSREDCPPRTVPAVAARLQALYLGGVPHRGEPVQPSFEDDLLDALDGPQLARELRHHLGPDLSRFAALRARGVDLKTIAESQQVAISTAHQRVVTAANRIRTLVRRKDVGPSLLEPLLVSGLAR